MMITKKIKVSTVAVPYQTTTDTTTGFFFFFLFSPSLASKTLRHDVGIGIFVWAYFQKTLFSLPWLSPCKASLVDHPAAAPW